MSKALDEVTKEAMELPLRQRLALAELLIGSADAAADPEAEAEWDSEIRDRIRAIEEGRVIGVACEEVMRAAEELPSRTFSGYDAPAGADSLVVRNPVACATG